MDVKLLNSNNTNRAKAEKLIFFFNGWGMDASVVEHLDKNGFDVVMFSNYSKRFELTLPNLSDYKKYYLVAWSMGVWAAAKIPQLKNIPFEKKIAINGTCQAIDNLKGIPVKIFEGTLRYLNTENKRKFDRRMFSSKEEYALFNNLKTKRTFSDQKEELQSIYEAASKDNSSFDYSKIHIGQNDLIFPFKNQVNYWEGKNYQIHDWAHFPFFNFNSWSEIIEA